MLWKGPELTLLNNTIFCLPNCIPGEAYSGFKKPKNDISYRNHPDHNDCICGDAPGWSADEMILF